MATLVVANAPIQVHGRQYALEPLVAMGHVTHEIPASGPTAAQLLHQAACRMGRSGPARPGSRNKPAR
eukprot:7786391-Lingulodinium_polyedra.AAC.1